MHRTVWRAPDMGDLRASGEGAAATCCTARPGRRKGGAASPAAPPGRAGALDFLPGPVADRRPAPAASAPAAAGRPTLRRAVGPPDRWHARIGYRLHRHARATLTGPG